MEHKTSQIKAAFAKAMGEAQTNPEALAAILETLLTSVSMCVGTMSGGNPTLVNELLEGASGYLFERAEGHRKLGAFMASASRMRGQS